MNHQYLPFPFTFIPFLPYQDHPSGCTDLGMTSSTPVLDEPQETCHLHSRKQPAPSCKNLQV